MRKTTECGALFRAFGGAVRVDFDHVTEGVHFVAVVVRTVFGGADLAVIPASEAVLRAGAFPAVARGFALFATVAVECDYALIVARGVIVGTAEKIARPVFFTREQGIPRGFACAAVV